jgi:hypothetical protein
MTGATIAWLTIATCFALAASGCLSWPVLW